MIRVLSTIYISKSGKGSFKSKDYRFSRVYLVRFSKGQLLPRDIDLNKNNIGRRATDTKDKTGNRQSNLRYFPPSRILR